MSRWWRRTENETGSSGLRMTRAAASIFSHRSFLTLPEIGGLFNLSRSHTLPISIPNPDQCLCQNSPLAVKINLPHSSLQDNILSQLQQPLNNRDDLTTPQDKAKHEDIRKLYIVIGLLKRRGWLTPLWLQPAKLNTISAQDRSLHISHKRPFLNPILQSRLGEQFLYWQSESSLTQLTQYLADRRPSWHVEPCYRLALLDIDPFLGPMDDERPQLGLSPLPQSAPAIVDTACLTLVAPADPAQRALIAQALKKHTPLCVNAPIGTGRARAAMLVAAAAISSGDRVACLADASRSRSALMKQFRDAGLIDNITVLDAPHNRLDPSTTNNIKNLPALSDNCQPQLSIAAIETARASRLKFISHYQRQLARIIPKVGSSVHDVIWQADYARMRLEAMGAFQTVMQLDLNLEADFDLAECQEHIAAFEGALALSRSMKSNPWAGLKLNSHISISMPSLRKDILDVLSHMESCCHLLTKRIESLRLVAGLALPPTLSAIDEIAHLRAAIPTPSEKIFESLLPKIATSEPGPCLYQISVAHQRYRKEKDELKQCLGELWPQDKQHLDALHQALLALPEAVESDWTQSELAELASTCRHNAQMIKDSLDMISITENLLDLALPKNAEGAAIASLALSTARSCPLSVIESRNPHLATPEGMHILKIARKAAQSLKDNQKRLARYMRIDALPEDDTLSHVAQQLYRSSLWTCWHPRYRRALNCAKRIIHPHIMKKASTPTCASLLNKAASWKQALKRFENHPKLHSVLGSAFLGIETDFAKFDALSRWIDSAMQAAQHGHAPVEKDSQRSAPEQDWLKRLLALPAETIAELAQLANTGLERLHILNTWSYPETRLADLNNLADKLERASSLWARLKTPDNDPTLGKLIAALERRSQCLQMESDIKADLLVHDLADLFDCQSPSPEAIKATHQWVEAIRSTPLIPARLAADLLKPGMTKRYTRLIHLLDEISNIADRFKKAHIYLVNLHILNEEKEEQDCHQTKIPFNRIAAHAQAALQAEDSLSNAIDLAYARINLDRLGLASLAQALEQNQLPLGSGALEARLLAMITKQLRTNPEWQRLASIDINTVTDSIENLDQELFNAHRSRIADRLRSSPSPACVVTSVKSMNQHLSRDYFDLILVIDGDSMNARHVADISQKAARTIVFGDQDLAHPTSLFNHYLHQTHKLDNLSFLHRPDSAVARFEASKARSQPLHLSAPQLEPIKGCISYNKMAPGTCFEEARKAISNTGQADLDSTIIIADCPSEQCESMHISTLSQPKILSISDILDSSHGLPDQVTTTYLLVTSNTHSRDSMQRMLITACTLTQENLIIFDGRDAPIDADDPIYQVTHYPITHDNYEGEPIRCALRLFLKEAGIALESLDNTQPPPVACIIRQPDGSPRLTILSDTPCAESLDRERALRDEGCIFQLRSLDWLTNQNITADKLLNSLAQSASWQHHAIQTKPSSLLTIRQA